MPNFTENYNLIKPLATENYDIEQLNNNADIIDEELHNLANADKYDLEEVKTGGIWLDGKPIYRKVFEIDDASLTAGSTQIALNIDSPETMTNLFATLEYATSTQPSIINVGSYWCSVAVPTTGDQIIRILCIDGNLMIYKQNDMSSAYKNLKIMVEFTKTTD